MDRFADKYPSSTPYHYVLNNPLRFTDPTGDTVKVDTKLLEHPVYTDGPNKGQPKKWQDMSDEEKQIVAFQQWWSENGQEVLELFGIGGKYETTNITFVLGTKPVGFWEGLFSNKGVEGKFRGKTTFGKRGTAEKDFYEGESRVTPEFGVEELDINIYFSPTPTGGARSTTPEHEYKHVRIIFDRVKTRKVVPTGREQHELSDRNKVPVVK